jgi:uncharacterized membrane protein YphA (DoxX/SURF4 family)
MMNETTRRRVMFICRLVVGAIFIYAAYVKLGESWLVFAQAIGAYKLLPDWAVIVLAQWLPWFELLLGLLLVSGAVPRFAGTAVTLVLLDFFAAMLHSYLSGQVIECGCGLTPGEMIGPKSLTRDGAILALSILFTVCAFLPPQGRKIAL